MSQTLAPDRSRQADLLTQYELLQRLGGSERASVHLARDRVLGQQVAIKLFRDEYSRDADRIARLYGIARGAATLGRPQIVAVYDHGASWHVAFITSDYIAGRDLAAVLAAGDPLPPGRAAVILAQILDALIATHGAGIMHGDLHPHNVLLRGESDAVVLTDFGVGGLFPAHGGATYTPYSAPELALTSAADIYAAGALLRAMLAPAGADAPTGQGAALLAIADRALAVDPAARYPDATAMRAALDTTVGPLALPAPLPRPSELVREPTERVDHRRPARRGRRAALLLASALFLGGIAGAVALVRSSPTPTPSAPTIAAVAPAPPPTEATIAAAPTPTEVAGATVPEATQASAPTVAPTMAATIAPSALPAIVPTSPPATAVPTAVPTATSAPTATVAPTPTVIAPVGYAATLNATQIAGAYRRDDGTLYGRPTVALYSVGTGYERGTIAFDVPTPPTIPLTLILTGLDDERAAQGTFTVAINDVIIFGGPTGFPNTPTTDHGVGGADRYWGKMEIAVPVGLLRIGSNTLTLENTTPGGRLGVPYILINAVQFAEAR